MSTILQDLISKYEHLKIREDSKLVEDTLGNLFIYSDGSNTVLKIHAVNGSLQEEVLDKKEWQSYREGKIAAKEFSEVRSAISGRVGGD